MKTVLFFISSSRHECRDRLDGIWRYAEKAGWRVQAVEGAVARANVRELLDFWKPSGAIVECGCDTTYGMYEAFGSLPVVYFDRDPRSCADELVVLSDSREVAEVAANELLSLGLRHYAYVPHLTTVYWSVDRGRAFAERIAAAGRECSTFSPRGRNGREAYMRAMAAWIAKLPKPCGIFAANDLTAEAVVIAAEHAGVRIPDEIAVLGVDNDEQICERTRPRLSSVVPDFEGGGYLAAKLLRNMMTVHRKTRGVRCFKVTKVVRRESTHLCEQLSKKAKSRSVVLASDYINAEAGNGIGVADVVRRMGCSRRTAEVRFRVEMDKTILEAINDRLFDLAGAQLLGGCPSVAAVADRLSVSRSTFDRIFLRRTGLPAKAWQAANDDVSAVHCRG